MLGPLVLSLALMLLVVAIVVPVFVVTDPFVNGTAEDRRFCETRGDRTAQAQLGHTGSSDLIAYRAEQIADTCVERSIRRNVYSEGPD